MRYTEFPGGSGPKVSALGFGCAALLGRVGRKESLGALGAAVDAGITFFDTARSYGYGESETLLGEFLAGRRREFVICTKFGILPGAKGGWKQKVKPVAQAAIRMFPGLREVARKASAGEMQGGQFSVGVLRESFETSLRELKTDYVDMLLLHAAPLSVLAQDDLMDALGRLVEQGKVRVAGVSGEEEIIREAMRQDLPVLKTAQFALNRKNLGFAKELVGTEMFLVGNHPFGGPDGVGETIARIAALRGDERLPAELREKLAAGSDRELMPEVLLNVILRDVSAVVPAMMRVENLRANARAVAECRFSDAELAVLQAELEG